MGLLLENARSSGIPLELLSSLGIKEVEGQELGEYGYENFLDSREKFLLIPYYDPFGDPIEWVKDGKLIPFARVKLPKNLGKKLDMKYSQPKGSPTKVYIPRGVDKVFHTCFGVGPDGEDLPYTQRLPMLRIVEGEKKAIKSTLEGTPTIGLGGVYGWGYRDEKGNRKLVDYLIEYVLQSEKIQIIFDSDIWTNSNIKTAIIKFSLFLGKTIVNLHKNYLTGKIPDSFDPILNDIDFKYFKGLNDKKSAYNSIVSKIGFSLLPIHPEGLNKYGIDDLLVDWDDRHLRAILRAWLPALKITGVEPEKDKLSHLFDVPLWKTHKSKVDNYFTEETKKGTPKRIELNNCWDNSVSNMLTLLLIRHTAKFCHPYKDGNNTYLWDFQKEVLELTDSTGFSKVFENICLDYKFSFASNGLRADGTDIISTASSDLPKEELCHYIGFKNVDINKNTGEILQIDPKRCVVSRSKYNYLTGEKDKPRVFLESLDRMLGDRVPVFRALLRLSFCDPRIRPGFIVNMFGPPGCGKSAIMRILEKILPGMVLTSLAIIIDSNTAMKNFIPLEWLGQSMVVDQDFKAPSIGSSMVQLFNQIAHGENVPYRRMGKQPVNSTATFALWMVSNKMVQVNAKDMEGFSRRIVPLEIRAETLSERDPKWVDTVANREGTRIIKWIFSLTTDEAQLILRDHRDKPTHKEKIIEYVKTIIKIV